MRIEGLEPACREVMQKGVNCCRFGRQIVLTIIDGREKSVWIASFVRAAGQEVGERVDAGLAYVSILLKVPLRTVLSG